MVVGVKHLIGALVLVAVLIGGAFTFGAKWHGDDSESAAVAAALTDTEVLLGEDSEAPAPEGEPLYAVVRIVDGDTFVVNIDGKNESVRLIGVDTPELNDSRTGVQCFAKEAAAKITELLSGQKVRLEYDPSQGERDKYKRLLAYVFREDGTFVNKVLIGGGYGHEYTYNEAYKYQAQFKAAEAAARDGEKGLWAPDACPVAASAPASKPAPQKTPAKTSQTAAAATPAQEVKIEVTEGSAPKEPVPTPEPQPEPAPQESQPEPEPEPAPPADAGGYTCSKNTYNCSDFSTQADAQAVYDQCGGVDNDIHLLDKNKDGSACDSLP